MTNREYVADLYPDSVVWDGFDDAIIGVTDSMQVVYDINKMVEVLMKEWETDKNKTDKPADFPENLTEEDAIEYLEYNVLSAYVGDFTPIHIWTIPKHEIQ